MVAGIGDENLIEAVRANTLGGLEADVEVAPVGGAVGDIGGATVADVLGVDEGDEGGGALGGGGFHIGGCWVLLGCVGCDSYTL